jgi:hypothetical protein
MEILSTKKRNRHPLRPEADAIGDQEIRHRIKITSWQIQRGQINYIAKPPKMSNRFSLKPDRVQEFLGYIVPSYSTFNLL